MHESLIKHRLNGCKTGILKLTGFARNRIIKECQNNTAVQCSPLKCSGLHVLMNPIFLSHSSATFSVSINGI